MFYLFYKHKDTILWMHIYKSFLKYLFRCVRYLRTKHTTGTQQEVHVCVCVLWPAHWIFNTESDTGDISSCNWYKATITYAELKLIFD